FNWIGVGCEIISLFLGIVIVVLGNSSGRGQRVRVWVFLPIAVHAILLALLLATTLWVIRWTGFPAGLAWCLPLGALALTVGVGAMVCLSCMLPADRVAVGSPRGTLVTAVLAGLGFAVALKLLAIPVFAADLAAAANVGRSAVCRANLHRIGIAILEYEAENRLYLPSGASGEPAALDRYFPSPPLRACPLEAESKNYIYVIDLLREVHRRKNGGDPTPVPWDFADGPGLFADPGNPHGSDQPRVRLKISLIPNMADAPLLWDRHPSHGGKIAVVAGDAHVMTLDPAELQKLLDDPKTGIAHWPAFVQDVPSR
ncbi:MAG: hypothetical protein JWP03_462, partial [Phycisphaerales bacterium]|nr:hypothetical protein [Phycisphaerales bacterium]